MPSVMKTKKFQVKLKLSQITKLEESITKLCKDLCNDAPNNRIKKKNNQKPMSIKKSMQYVPIVFRSPSPKKKMVGE